jgi:nitroimidazol reductase NimA-like FMN-containing flavoprotein (pyridoxamine 5'-phosphate oxidase superfamily)
MPAVELTDPDPGWVTKHALTTPSPNWSEHLVRYDKDLVLSILREGFFCHIGYWDTEELEDEQHIEIPARVRVIVRQYGLHVPESPKNPVLYLHGPDSPAGDIPGHCSRLYRLVTAGTVKDVCVTVGLVDGIGVGCAAHHSTLDYRSVVIYGKASVVENDNEKELALKVFSDHVIAPGYSAYSRQANQSERDYVGVIKIEVEHASSKVRIGEPSAAGPQEEPDPDVWAGTVPVTQVYGPARRASYVTSEKPVPEFVQNLVRGGRGELRVPAVPSPLHPATTQAPGLSPFN